MAIKKKSVKSIKSTVTKKTAMKKTGRGGSVAAKKAAVKKSPVKKAVLKKAPVKKAPIKKVASKKAVLKKTAVKKKVATVNPAVDKLKALKDELVAVKAELKASQKREAGLAKIAGNMSAAIEKSVSSMMKSELASLEKSLKPKPRKRKARVVKVDVVKTAEAVEKAD